ncbi:MAG: hypothetical protein WCR06_03065 [bacterium]
MIVVAMIALLAAIAIPLFMKSRQDSRWPAFVNNLRLIDHAKQQVATVSKTLTDSSTPSEGFEGRASRVSPEVNK